MLDLEKLAKDAEDQAQMFLMNYHRSLAAAITYRDVLKRQEAEKDKKSSLEVLKGGKEG